MSGAEDTMPAGPSTNAPLSPSASTRKLRSSNDDLTLHRPIQHGASASASGPAAYFDDDARRDSYPGANGTWAAEDAPLYTSGERRASLRRGSVIDGVDDASIRVEHGDRSASMGGMGLADGGLAQRKAQWLRSAMITGMFILAWYTFATLLSLYNKWMFSDAHYGFSYPLFVTACHMAIQAGLASIVRSVFPVYKPKERPSRQDYVVKIIPCAFSTGGDIGLSNLSLKTITLSLYTMCKSSTLIFVLGFAFAFRLEAYSLRLVSVILLISVGVFLMVFDTTAVSVPGIVMVFSASAFAGLRWALTETLMHKRKMGLGNPFATIFWLSPISGAVLAIVSMFVEDWAGIFGKGHFDGIPQSALTIGAIILPGAIAFAMVSSEYFIIQRAGIVPLSIAGIVKEVTTIMISSWVFGDELTGLNIVGVFIAVTGIAVYSFHKYQKSIGAQQENGTNDLAGDEEAIHLYAPARTSADRHTAVSSSGQSRRASAADDLDRDENKPSPKGRTAEIRGTANHSRDSRSPDRWTDDGWDESWKDNDDDDDRLDDELRDDEVLKARAQREGERRGSAGSSHQAARPGSLKARLTRSWGPWWDQSM